LVFSGGKTQLSTEQPVKLLPGLVAKLANLKCFFFSGSFNIGVCMDKIAFLQEIQQLQTISERLTSLAGEHPVAAEALLILSGNIRHNATLLELLLITRIEPLSGRGPANA